jgi:membrane protease YdiL (CAAX protease family)
LCVIIKIKSLINWKLFRILLALGLFGFFAVLPFLLNVQGDALRELAISIPTLLLLSLVQTTVLLSVAIFLGLLLGKKIGLGVPLLERWIAGRPQEEKIKPLASLSIKLGALAGILIIGFDFVFNQFMEPIAFADVPLWQGFLGSFYGGIVEEILLRLLLVTLIVWILFKFSKSKADRPAPTSVWIAIIVAAIIFGLGHLPATALLTTITPLVIARAVVLNGIGGIVFGWLYWKKGLESAMIAHFTADIVLLVVLPLLLTLH